MSKLTLNEAAEPGTPATGKVAVYAKADGKLYLKDDAGTESDLTAGAAGGETNTASNSGTDGVGVWDAKVGVDLEFRHIAPASNKVTVTLDAGDDDIDIDVAEANFDLSSTALDGAAHERAASLGAAPSKVVIKVIIGPPDTAYITMKITGDTWAWIPLVTAP